jgi:hypothetical protein
MIMIMIMLMIMSMAPLAKKEKRKEKIIQRKNQSLIPRARRPMTLKPSPEKP